ncbi:hypothetical protein YYC_00213 [Plasmodium yoelii 17X]|uniref:Uncharacterized protein n=1 Tax=Plasmodium yoelii 17X TaxID=1323249 RepID=V7PWE5_PLAYE|nr:hypothetical protein YYC_00213 [Plasmodium yoelii 17X]
MEPFNILKKIVIFQVIICSFEYPKNILYDIRKGQNVYSQTNSTVFRNDRILKGSKHELDVNYFYESVMSIASMKDEHEECGETQGEKYNEHIVKLRENNEKYRNKNKYKETEICEDDLDYTDIDNYVDDGQASEIDEITSVDDELLSVYDKRADVSNKRASIDGKGSDVSNKRASIDGKGSDVSNKRASIYNELAKVGNKRADVNDKKPSIDGKGADVSNKRASIDGKGADYIRF